LRRATFKDTELVKAEIEKNFADAKARAATAADPDPWAKSAADAA
jgi:hypothetical protein